MSATQVLDRSLSAPLGLLTEAVARLRAQVPADLPGAQALAETALLLREAEKLQAVVLARLVDVHTRELHVLDDAPTAGVWVERQQVGLGRDRVALATRLQRLPQVALHLAEGLVSMPSAVLISRALEQVRPHLDRSDGLLDDQPAEQVLTAVIVDGVRDLVATARGGLDDADPELAALSGELQRICAAPLPARARVEAAFLVLAGHVQPGDLKAALGRLVDALLPLRLEDRAGRAHSARGLTLRPHGDGSGWTVHGELDAETGELLHTVVAASRATDPAAPEDTLAWMAQRAQEPSAPTPRSRKQQDHDALTLALRRLLDSGALGLRDKARPHLLVTVPLDQLQGRPGALPATGAVGTSLPASLVQRLGCDSRITRLVLSAGRKVIETSHTERTLKPHERKALLVQWGGRCAGAGCPSPPGTPLVPHHATPWHATGTTSYTDSVPLCDTTHHDLHTGGKTLRLRDGRRLGPSGWVLPAR